MLFGCGKRKPHTLWECKLIQPLWKTEWRPLKKLKIDLPYDPAIPLLGILPNECKSSYYKEWIKKMWCLYTIEFY
jgi:hypothetical protein